MAAQWRSSAQQRKFSMGQHPPPGHNKPAHCLESISLALKLPNDGEINDSFSYSLLGQSLGKEDKSQQCDENGGLHGAFSFELCLQRNLSGLL